MKRFMYHLSVAASLTVLSLYPWSSEEAKGEQPIILGKLTTQEGNSYNVTNISIGKSRTDQSKVVLYEKPKDLKPSDKGNVIPVNPAKTLTTTTLELQKIKIIQVPEPHRIWKWTNQESKRSVKLAYDYIEVIVTWRSGGSVHYLLELGPENSKRPLKIYCDVIDKKISGTKADGVILCQKIEGVNLRKKGAPFPSIKSIAFDEPCYKIPQEDGGGMKATK